MSCDDLRTDGLLAQGLTFLKHVISSYSGSCSIITLHGHFGRATTLIRSVLGRNPDGLSKLLKSLPEDFVLTKLENGDLLVSQFQRQESTTAGNAFISWLMRDYDCLQLEYIVEELRRAKPCIQQLVRTTDASVLAFLQRHPKEFVVSGSIVRRREEGLSAPCLSPKALRTVVDFIKERLGKKSHCLSTEELMMDMMHLAPHLLQILGEARMSVGNLLHQHPEYFMIVDEGYVHNANHSVLPTYHRRPLKTLKKGCGVIHHDPPHHGIFFGGHVLVTDSQFLDLMIILKEGCTLDCLYLPSKAKQGFRYIALRVWKADSKKQCLELASAQLGYPLLCGAAKVAYHKAGVGFLTVSWHSQHLEDDKAVRTFFLTKCSRDCYIMSFFI